MSKHFSTIEIGQKSIWLTVVKHGRRPIRLVTFIIVYVRWLRFNHPVLFHIMRLSPKHIFQSLSGELEIKMSVQRPWTEILYVRFVVNKGNLGPRMPSD